MNQPTRGLPVRLHLLVQCLLGQMSLYFSWRQEGVRIDGGRHCFQFAAFPSVCTIIFLNEAGDCNVSKMLPCCCLCSSTVVDSLVGYQGEEHKRHQKAKTFLSSSLRIRAWPALLVSCTVLFHLILSEGWPHGLLSSHYMFLINGETGV